MFLSWNMNTTDTPGSTHHVTGQLEDSLRDDSPREECSGVFGVWAPVKKSQNSPTTASTPCSTAGRRQPVSPSRTAPRCWSSRIWVWSVRCSTSELLAAMPGHVAIGHCRYSTTGSTTWENAQPVFRNTAAGTGIALGHNGNLVNTRDLAERARSAGLINHNAPGAATTDSDILGALLAAGAADTSIEQAALELLPTVRGAFCLVFMDETTLYAARDPHGVRPLSLGRLDRGWVVASRAAALDIVGASFVRDIEPGELLAIDSDGVRFTRFAPPTPRRASSSTSTWPGRTASSPAAPCTPPGSTSVAGWRGRSRSTPTW